VKQAAPAIGQVRSVEKLALAFKGRELPLDGAELIIGRSSKCDVVLDSVLVSRRHARILILQGRVLVEDMGSRNGVFLNSRQVESAMEMSVGDFLVVGDQQFQLVLARKSSLPPPRSSEIEAPRSVSEPDVGTRSASAFELLAGVVDKALTAGRGEEAERLLSGHIRRVMAEVQRGVRQPANVSAQAAGYAIKLARANNKPSWLDFAVQLYSELGQPMSLQLVDELYEAVRRVDGCRSEAVREYVAMLRLQVSRLSPAERFVLERLESLERLMAMKRR